MKRSMLIFIVCASMNIFASDTEILEQAAWQRQYMPLARVGNNHASNSYKMLLLALFCGPAVMVKPVMQPIDCIQMPTQSKHDMKKQPQKIVTLQSLAEYNLQLESVMACLLHSQQVVSRRLTFKDIDPAAHYSRKWMRRMHKNQK